MRIWKETMQTANTHLQQRMINISISSNVFRRMVHKIYFRAIRIGPYLRADHSKFRVSAGGRHFCAGWLVRPITKKHWQKTQKNGQNKIFFLLNSFLKWSLLIFLVLCNKYTWEHSNCFLKFFSKTFYKKNDLLKKFHKKNNRLKTF